MSEPFQSPDPQPVAEACDSKKSLISGTTSGCGSGDKCQMPEKCLCCRKPKREAYIEFLETRFWKELSLEIRRKANFRCSKCGKQPGRKKIHAHHTNYPFCWFNTTADILIPLCEDCHNIEHGKKPRKAKKRKRAVPETGTKKLTRRERRRIQKEKRRQRKLLRAARRVSNAQKYKWRHDEVQRLSDFDIERIRSMKGINAKDVAAEFGITRNLAVCVMHKGLTKSAPINIKAYTPHEPPPASISIVTAEGFKLTYCKPIENPDPF